MELGLWTIFIVNIGVNSFLSFFSISLLVWLSIKILRIKSAGLQALCCLIPFGKLMADLACYQFSNWALAQQLNPLACPIGTRYLTVGMGFPNPDQCYFFPLCYIRLLLEEGQTFTLADILCLSMGPYGTMVCALVLLAGLLGSLGKAIFQRQNFKKWVKKIETSAQPCLHPIQDNYLKNAIDRKKATIYLSESVYAPCIMGQLKPKIFLPFTLFQELTPQEFEAVITHEMAHVNRGDLFLNSCLFWICSMFWWVPTGCLKRQLELAQEYACDRSLLKTSLDPLYLAEALYKASRGLVQPPVFARSFVSSHSTVKRIKVLLSTHPSEWELMKWIKYPILISLMVSILLGKFWIF